MDYPNQYLDRRTGKQLEGEELQKYLNYEMHDSCTNCFFNPADHLAMLQFWTKHRKMPGDCH